MLNFLPHTFASVALLIGWLHESEAMKLTGTSHTHTNRGKSLEEAEDPALDLELAELQMPSAGLQDESLTDVTEGIAKPSVANAQAENFIEEMNLINNFQAWDTDGNGRLSQVERFEANKGADSRAAQEQDARIVEAVSKDLSATITKDDLKKAIMHERSGVLRVKELSVAQAADAFDFRFNSLDVDGDHLLSEVEFDGLLDYLNVPGSEEVLLKTFHRMDLDSSGMITKSELARGLDSPRIFGCLMSFTNPRHAGERRRAGLHDERVTDAPRENRPNIRACGF